MDVLSVLLSLTNLGVNIKQGKEINSIQQKMSYIRDDISWIESNEINQLLSNQAALRANYERDLAKLFSNKQQSLELNQAISALSSSASFSDPKIYGIMLASIDNISLLLNSTSETLMQMFDINEATLDKVLDLISEINSLKLKFNLEDADLQLKISNNSQLIIKLSEQQLAHQLSTLQSFEGLRNDLELINAQVDKKMADFGVLSTNTTGVILNDGTFKLADTLDLVTTEVFDITLSEVVHNSSTSVGMSIQGSTSIAPSVNVHPGKNTSFGTYYHATTSCNQLNLLTSTLIKKFSKDNHTGVGLLLNRPYKLLISNINPQRELFLFLRGAGLNAFDGNGLSVDFVPAIAKWRPISYTTVSKEENMFIYKHSSNAAVMRSVTWGQPGSYKIPSSNNHVKIGTIFTASVAQRSDNLIVIKIRLSPNYASVIASGTVTGAIISGVGIPSNNVNSDIVSGGSFVMPNSGDILAGGSFIVNLPINHLSFGGIECAQ